MAVRTVTEVRVEVVVNGKRNAIRTIDRNRINALLQDKTPLGEFLREMVLQILDGADTLDTGENWMLDEG